MPHPRSDEAVEEAVLASQHARHDARLADPAWTLIESTDALGGLVWRRATLLTNMFVKE